MSDHILYVTVWILCSIGAILFLFVMLFGAPFLPTRSARVGEALDLLDLKRGQTLLELGSGDGRMLREAARRGIHGIGYELNPLLVLWSRFRCWRWRQLVKIHCANYWNVRLPKAEGIYVFLLQPYMARLDRKIIEESVKPLALVSFAFYIPNKKPSINQNGLYLYRYGSAKRPNPKVNNVSTATAIIE